MKKPEEIFKPEDGWKEVEDKSGCWKPKQIGDFIYGVYQGIESNVGKHHSDVFLLKGFDGIEYKVFASKNLKEKMTDITQELKEKGTDIIGMEIGFYYKESKKSAPPKSNFKIFGVFYRPASEDNNPITIDRPVTSETKPEEKTSSLADADDPEAVNTIGIYEDIWRDKNHGTEKDTATCDQILKVANADDDLTDEDMMKIKLQLVRDKKAGRKI